LINLLYCRARGAFKHEGTCVFILPFDGARTVGRAMGVVYGHRTAAGAAARKGAGIFGAAPEPGAVEVKLDYRYRDYQCFIPFINHNY